MKERQANCAHTNKYQPCADVRRALAKLKTSHFTKVAALIFPIAECSLITLRTDWSKKYIYIYIKNKNGCHQTWAPRLQKLEGDKEQWNLVYRWKPERVFSFFFFPPHYFTTDAKKTKATFGSDAKMHQMEAVSSRQHMPGLQQRVHFVSTPTPPPSSSFPQRCWFPFCCICIFTHTQI